MATAGDITYNVNCQVNEGDKKTITLTYSIRNTEDTKHTITWEWIHQLSEDGTSSHVAEMIAHKSKRGHKSKPIPDDVYKKLGSSPKKTREGQYFMVKMSREDGVSIGKYFTRLLEM